MVELCIPFEDKIIRFLFDKQIIRRKNGEIKPCARKSMVRCTELEIVSAYNAELRGICNYYSMASNYNRISYFAYLMEYSCLKTLAAKNNSNTHKIIAAHQDGKGKWCIPYYTKAGEKNMYFADYTECKGAKNPCDTIPNAATVYSNSITTFESRLAAKICELCGATDGEYYEIHHVNKVKNLEGKAQWERVMIAKRRKTMVVCRKCHHEIHEY